MMKATTLALLLLVASAPGFAQSASPGPKEQKPRTLVTDDRKNLTPSPTVAGATTPKRDVATPASNGEIRKADELGKNSDVSRTAVASGTNEKTSLTEIYRVGVGDVLDIRLLNSSNSRSTLFTVMNGGLIDMPVAGGQIIVAGMTTDEIQRHLSLELKRRAVEENTKIFVGVRQFASHSVMVSGLVGNPGTRYLRREAMPLYVLLAESQVRSDAGRVAIMRGGSSGKPLDLNEPSAMDVTVITGDVVVVSARPQEFYYIAGRIVVPGQKSFHQGITLWQAILAAGGTQHGESLIEVSRENAQQKMETTRFNLKEIKAGHVEDPKLEAGDRIEIIK